MVCTITGNGLKDPTTALDGQAPIAAVPADAPRPSLPPCTCDRRRNERVWPSTPNSFARWTVQHLQARSFQRAIGFCTGPWGLAVSDMIPRLPLPTKIAIEVQEPISADDIAGEDDDTVNERVLASLQSGVDRLAAQRRFPVIG